MARRRSHKSLPTDERLQDAIALARVIALWLYVVHQWLNGGGPGWPTLR